MIDLVDMDSSEHGVYIGIHSPKTDSFIITFHRVYAPFLDIPMFQSQNNDHICVTDRHSLVV
jgi:hypothetical protein